MSLVVNDWHLFYFRLFKERLDCLEREVTTLAAKDTEGFIHHPKAKLLKAIVNNVRHEVPQQPDHKDYRLGKTLGAEYTDWRCVKKHGLPPRYRMFFKFTSQQRKIVYVWLNDEHSLRKDGSQTDVYEVFKKMLRRGEVPKSFEDLLKGSTGAK
jgi:toxin YhaV